MNYGYARSEESTRTIAGSRFESNHIFAYTYKQIARQFYGSNKNNVIVHSFLKYTCTFNQCVINSGIMVLRTGLYLKLFI